MKHLKFLRRPGGCHGGWGLLGLGLLVCHDKVLHKREVCYLGFGDVVQLSTKINHIEHKLGKRFTFWYPPPNMRIMHLNKRY